MRVCLYFVLFCPLLSSFLSSILSFCSCVCLSFCPLCSCFYLFSCFPRLVLLDAWLLILVLSFLFVGCCCFLFPCGCMGKRKGAPCWCVLASWVVGCFIWLLLYIPRTRQVSTRLYRNKVLEKGNLTECSKLFCARLYSYLCSSKFVLFLFSYLLPLVGSCFLSPFRLGYPTT